MFKQKNKLPTPELKIRSTNDFNNKLNNPNFAQGYWCAVFKLNIKSSNPDFKIGYEEGINDINVNNKLRR